MDGIRDLRAGGTGAGDGVAGAAISLGAKRGEGGDPGGFRRLLLVASGVMGERDCREGDLISVCWLQEEG